LGLIVSEQRRDDAQQQRLCLRAHAIQRRRQHRQPRFRRIDFLGPSEQPVPETWRAARHHFPPFPDFSAQHSPTQRDSIRSDGIPNLSIVARASASSSESEMAVTPSGVMTIFSWIRLGWAAIIIRPSCNSAISTVVAGANSLIGSIVCLLSQSITILTRGFFHHRLPSAGNPAAALLPSVCARAASPGSCSKSFEAGVAIALAVSRVVASSPRPSAPLRPASGTKVFIEA